jgi:hypothetical protein
MAKKKAKPLEREERPEFLAMLASLPDDIEAMHARAGRLRAIYNDAIIAGDEDARAAATLEHDAIVYKLNGGTFFGCRGDDTRPGRVLDAQHVAKPGQVPHWGQDGEFLVEVDGVRVLVKYECQGLRSAPGFDATAVDFDKPFISPTGYQSVYLTVTDHMGRTLEQAVRAEIAAQIAAEGLKSITKEDLRWIEKRPAWLVDVLAGVTRDGQLAMFGDQPEPKKPLSGAERQKRRRDKLRELKEKEGLKPVMLTDLERLMLFAALDLENAIKPHDEQSAPLHLALLQKIYPGASWTDEAQRIAAGILKSDANQQAADRWRIEADRQRAEASRWAKRAQEAESTLRKSPDLAARVAWLEQENAQVIEERGRAFRAVEVLTQRLRDAGLSTDYRG